MRQKGVTPRSCLFYMDEIKEESKKDEKTMNIFRTYFFDNMEDKGGMTYRNRIIGGR